MTLKRLSLILFGALVLVWTFGTTAAPVSAHGTDIAYTTATQVQLEARFDTGEPMANAQVTIYAPDDPQNPWMTATADEAGRFAFTPDTSIPGRWDIFVRTAGHGNTLYIDVDAESTAITGVASAGSGLTTVQIILMSAAGIWGFIGTALYFARGRKTAVPARDNERQAQDEFVPGKVTT